ncbi:galactokinase [Jeotgalibacillus haloalkalitolerans]|uniref:Galactokinase n=1 Tax=Jeotgalibacillus haloalkalitolerans TaxID=3104292 RepID=A0ABU5KJ06_9BACL|nr:galactokinase [Jeotgalibacillus sp. HH7-29]MDZ5711234.1 galactokinase [Jeotgalibacillus sp. HH7-29]
MNVYDLKQSFISIFNEAPERLFFAPGRINLIGEHTDYNGGKVFPLAITYGTYAYVRERNDKKVRLASTNFPQTGIITASLDQLEKNLETEWVNYPLGVIYFLKESGYKVERGFDVLFEGNIPNGAGLSSSASIEMAAGVMAKGLAGLSISQIELIKLCQRVENEYIGVNSGIMDQFAIGMGRQGQALWLDCDTLDFEYAPIELEHEKIVIMNTNKRRELASSKYNERRAECEKALKIIQKHTSVESLGELSVTQLSDVETWLNDSLLYKRVKHVVTENERTKLAFVSLKAGDLEQVGQLMNASHQSLKEDYEVTGEELDTLAEFAQVQPGVIGSRMTGAGFGGCAIAIVKTDAVDEFIKQTRRHYQDRIGYGPDFYVASVGDGAKEIAIEGVEQTG